MHFHIQQYFEVLVYVKLIAFPDAPFVFAGILFKEILHAFCPRTFELLGGKLSRVYLLRLLPLEVVHRYGLASSLH